jgi:hypothetical protein
MNYLESGKRPEDDNQSVLCARVNGEDYYFVAMRDSELDALAGSEWDGGQCENCGSFDPASGEPVAYHVQGRYVRCDACGRERSIVYKAAREVVFPW